jgi:hypothetical protein
VKPTLTSEEAVKQLLAAAIEVRDTLDHPTRSVDALMAGRLDDAIKNFRPLAEMPTKIIGDGKTIIKPGRYRITFKGFADIEDNIVEPCVSWHGWCYQSLTPTPGDGKGEG